MTSDSGREGGGGNGPADVTAKASLADSRSATHGSLSGVVGRVASASALAQLVGQSVSFVQTIGLARLLTSTDVGIFAAGTVLTALFMNLVEGGLRAGLVQRQRNLADADETVFWVTLMFGAAASLGCLAAAPVIGIIFHSHTVGLVAAATSGPPAHPLADERPGVGSATRVQRQTAAVRGAGHCRQLRGGGGRPGRARVGRVVHGRRRVRLLHRRSDRPSGCSHPGGPAAAMPPSRCGASWRGSAFRSSSRTLAIGCAPLSRHSVVGRVLSTGALGFFRYGERIPQIPQTGIIEVGATTLFPAFSRIAVTVNAWPPRTCVRCTGPWSARQLARA